MACLGSAYLEAFLAGLDGGDIAGNTTADDDEVLLLCKTSAAALDLFVLKSVHVTYQSVSRSLVVVICGSADMM